MNLRPVIGPLTAFALVVVSREAFAQGRGGAPLGPERAPGPPAGGLSETELAKKAQNPISNLLNVPVEQNFNFKTGLSNRTQYNLNLQPNIPIAIDDRYSIVTRLVLPLYDQPVRTEDRVFGLGDMNASVFLTRPLSRTVAVGVGPSMSLPTATNAQLGTEKWSLGPAAVVSATFGPWVLGAIGSNRWSFAGDKDRASTNDLTLQPYAFYNFSNGWAIGTAPILSANWKAGGSDVFLIPIGGGVSKVLRLDNKVALNLSVQGYVNATKAIDGPDGQVRTTLALLLPN